ncbi:MAG: TerB family tellurite resistance protein [Pseudomonadota bacterium]
MSDTIITSKLDGDVLIVETDRDTETYDAQFLVAAMMIFIARGSGTIEPEETAKMLELIEHRFQLQGSESLRLLTRAMSELADKPELVTLLGELGTSFSEDDKEEIALMALKVVAADGQREVEEMERFNEAMEALGVSADIKHRAFDRYFSETMPGL